MSIHARIFPLSGATWDELGPLWTQLLSFAVDPPPFLDWEWLRLWWTHFDPTQHETAHLCVAYDGAEPIGALPVVAGPVRRSPGVRLVSVQSLGSRLFDSRGVFSEYLGIAGPPLREREACSAILRAVQEQFRPGEFAVGWTRQRRQWTEALAATPGSYVRIASREKSYQADLRNGFSAYASSLGASTRRSLLNLRARLEASGTLSITHSANVSDAFATLDELNHLHAGRWGSPAFKGRALAFHRDLISRWFPMGRVALSRLMLDGRCISCLYDLRMGTTQYNIQLGFDSGFQGKVSLGLIHLGYAMEQASSNQIRTYDFLAGRGRRSNYKANLASRSQDVATIQALSGSRLTTLYRFVDLLRGGTGA